MTAAVTNPRGLVTRRTIHPLPPAPSADVLGNALVVPDMPIHKRPMESRTSHILRRLARWGLVSRSSERILYWEVQDLIAGVISAVSFGEIAGAGAVKRGSVRHPYDLRPAFERLPTLPDSLRLERRYLELVLNRVLRRYGEQMSIAKGSPFSFESEAREFFVTGARLERFVRHISAEEERMNALQAIHDAYHHGRHYYAFALLRRERLAPDNKLFLQFARASYFQACLTWEGTLLPKPDPHRLPGRRAVAFLLQRDKSVPPRYVEDESFRTQIRTALAAFPE